MDAYDAIISRDGRRRGRPWHGIPRLRASVSSCSSAATGFCASDLWPRHAYMKNEIPVAGCAHQAGTCRFGMDPVTSALNTDCRDQLDNLYVVDTSVFPEHRAGEPGAHRDGQRAPRRRTHAHAAGLTRGER
jgi:choline dehydrogenase-like flavoprotein